jgi:Family of unknown function (DUF5762)
MSQENRYLFWLDDPSVLYSDDNYKKILPENGMTRVEQLNAVTRFCIYFLILLLIFNKDSTWFYIPIIIIIFVIILYYLYINDPEGKYKELMSSREIYDTNFGQDTEIQNYNKQPEYAIESGNYDSNGDLYLGEEYDIHTNTDKNLYYTVDDVINYENATCRKPTTQNPFMNPILTDYDSEFPPQACNADDDQIKELMEENFNQNLYMDIDDLYNIKNSQRQFYTLPIPSIPNDQTGLAEWLYKTPLTCKQDQENCLRFVDLRYSRHI